MWSQTVWWRPLLRPRTALAGGVLLTACDTGPSDVVQDADPTETPVAAAIHAYQGSHQVAPTGTAVPVPPAVQVTDSDGHAVPGVAVRFEVAGDGGSIVGEHQVTDALGIATVTFWILAEAPGTNTVTATTDDLPESAVTITATGVGILDDLHFVGVPYQTLLPGASSGGGDSPHGVVVLDLDGDGLLDIATAACISRDVTVFLGNGDGTLRPLTESSYFSVGRCPRWIVTGDFNGDGVADLATVNRDDGSLSILLGNGDATFEVTTGFGTRTGSSPVGLAVADVDGDGILDLVTANAGANSISVFLGQGDGTFAARSDFSVSGRPEYIVTADFDQDGTEDVAVSIRRRDYGPPIVSVLLGRGDGTFQPPLDQPADPRRDTHRDHFPLAVADLDGDGVPDLIAGNVDAASVSVLFGKGDGTFHPRVDLWAAPAPTQVVIADFNGDGTPDFLVASERTDGCALCGGPFTLYLGTGDGAFEGPFDVGIGGCWATGIAAVDLNQNGRPELVIPDGGNDLMCLSFQEARP